MTPQQLTALLTPVPTTHLVTVFFGGGSVLNGRNWRIVDTVGNNPTVLQLDYDGRTASISIDLISAIVV